MRKADSGNEGTEAPAKSGEPIAETKVLRMDARGQKSGVRRRAGKMLKIVCAVLGAL